MAALTLFVRTNGEDGTGGRAHHSLCDTPQDQAAKARASCRRHHDQIDVVGLGGLDDRTVRRSHGHDACHLDLGSLGLGNDLRHIRGGLALQILQEGCAQMRRDIALDWMRRELDDMQNGQLGAELLR